MGFELQPMQWLGVALLAAGVVGPSVVPKVKGWIGSLGGLFKRSESVEDGESLDERKVYFDMLFELTEYFRDEGDEASVKDLTTVYTRMMKPEAESE